MLRGCISCNEETDIAIWEISKKIGYITDHHRQQQEQWHIYCSSLVQRATPSEVHLHHATSCAPDKELYSMPFGHSQVSIALAEGLNSHTIGCYVKNRDGGNKYLVAQVTLMADDMVDGRISDRSRDQVLEYYLAVIATVHDRLHDVIERDQPMNLNHLALIH